MNQTFSALITVKDTPTPITTKLGDKVLYVTLRAKTNGFTVVTDKNSISGFPVANAASITLPAITIAGYVDLANTYLMNTVAETICVVEMIGMREV